MRESQAIQRLRRIATSPAALGLTDDTALFEGLVLTHDSIAEGVHFLPSDPAASVGWKLVAVNLSDLAAKGATPAVALLSLALSGDEKWDMSFLDGIEAASAAGIVVTKVPDYCIDEVSDHAMALLLALVRKIPSSSARTHGGRWEMKAVVPIHRLRASLPTTFSIRSRISFAALLVNVKARILKGSTGCCVSVLSLVIR